MPKLWNETIEAHRRAVRDATLEAAAALVAERGLRAVTMSEIAERAGIGRATLYKYFPDIESILTAWHQRRISNHLDYLAEVRDRQQEPGDRLASVLEAFALIERKRVRRHRAEPHGAELATFLHRDEQMADAQGRLHGMIRDLVREAAEAGRVRRDAGADQLAGYCIHALGAARHTRSDDEARRLVTVVLDGLRPSG